MTPYLDTSLLVPLFIKEPKSADAMTWLMDVGSADLAVSPWTVAEFASALGIKIRNREIDETVHRRVLAEFHAFRDSRVRNVVQLDGADFQRAAELCGHWHLGLRAGDALHLAIAERREFTVCTLDRGMAAAAQTLGLPFETF